MFKSIVCRFCICPYTQYVSKTVKLFGVATTIKVMRCERFAQAIHLSVYLCDNCFNTHSLRRELRYFRLKVLFCFSFTFINAYFTSLFHCQFHRIGCARKVNVKSQMHAQFLRNYIYAHKQSIVLHLFASCWTNSCQSVYGVVMRQNLTNYLRRKKKKKKKQKKMEGRENCVTFVAFRIRDKYQIPTIFTIESTSDYSR